MAEDQDDLVFGRELRELFLNYFLMIERFK